MNNNIIIEIIYNLNIEMMNLAYTKRIILLFRDVEDHNSKYKNECRMNDHSTNVIM
jgi:hypothetical protein